MNKKTAGDIVLVAYCGLYCGSCRQYKNDNCTGCRENDKAAWCKIRRCCMEKKIFTCSDCDEFSNPGDCRKYHTFFSRIIEFCFRTDRTLCLEKIKQTGTESFASQMEEKGWLSIPKKKG